MGIRDPDPWPPPPLCGLPPSLSVQATEAIIKRDKAITDLAMAATKLLEKL